MTARENLRTTRDTVPRDGWHALNDLYLYVSSEADRAIDRRIRERFLYRVIADSRRLDGILATAMTHDEAYVMWRLGRAIERADMTTRVLGVRAAAVLSLPDGDVSPVDVHDELQWMGVLQVAGRAADVPARRARTDRGPSRRGVPARRRTVPTGRAGAPAGDPPRPG